MNGLGTLPKTIEKAIGAADDICRLFRAVVVMQWAPPHCGMKGNETADSLTLEAALAVPTLEAPSTFQQATTKV